MSDGPDDPTRGSVPIPLVPTARRMALQAAARGPERGAEEPARSSRRPPAGDEPRGAIGYLRSRLGAAGTLLAAMLVLFAIFADMLASDLPIACKWRGQLWLFPNVTQPAALVSAGGAVVASEAEWTISTPVAHGPGAGPGTGTAKPLLAPGDVKGHPFGTDGDGRDVFARVVHGARTYLVFALAAVVVSLALGSLLGGLGGLLGGGTDALLGRSIEAVSAFPPLVLVLGIQAAVPRATTATLFFAIALTRWPEVARLVRAEVMHVSTRDYVMAARALGASPLRVLRRHVAPNVRGQLMVLAAAGVPAVILIEASLDFLRVGGGSGMPSWGETMSEFRDAPGAWWLLAFPAAMLFATIVALNLVGEARREQLDPRAR